MSAELDAMKPDLRLIGHPRRKIEGLDKSTGRAVYTIHNLLSRAWHGSALLADDKGLLIPNGYDLT